MTEPPQKGADEPGGVRGNQFLSEAVRSEIEKHIAMRRDDPAFQALLSELEESFPPSRSERPGSPRFIGSRTRGKPLSDALRTDIERHIAARRADPMFRERLARRVEQEREITDRLREDEDATGGGSA